MPLKLPDFSDPLLHSLLICAHPKSPALKLEDEVDWDAKYGGGFWVHLTIENSTDVAIHAHLDAVRKFGEKKEDPTHSVDQIAAKFDEIAGSKSNTWLLATYRLPKDQRPQKGVIPALSFSMEVGDESVSINGASLSFKGKDFDELKWSLREDGSLEVTIDAFREITLDDDIFFRAEAILRGGFRRFVLGIPVKHCEEAAT